MKKAVYPGSFDPVTLGHIDVIERASKLFDHLIVGVLDNSAKKALFTTDERVDMLKEAKNGNYSIFSNSLKDKINNCLANGEQVLLLLNKRGYAHNQTCKSCGYTFKCPHCEVPLTYHKNDNTLKCHYCGLSTPKVNYCPSCGSTYLRSGGFGTQKVEEEIAKLFPSAKVARMDYDSATVTKKFQSILDDFGERRTKIYRNKSRTLAAKSTIRQGLEAGSYYYCYPTVYLNF